MTVILRTTGRATNASSASPALLTDYWRPGTGGGSTADATDALARVRASWNAFAVRISNVISIAWDRQVLAIEDTTGDVVGVFTGAAVATVVGTGTGDRLPAQTQGWSIASTGLVVGGRVLKGKKFIIAPMEVDNSVSGAPSAAYIAAIDTGLNGMLVGGATLSFPVVWHRPVGGAGGTSIAITSWATQPTWAVQRRRRDV